MVLRRNIGDDNMTSKNNTPAQIDIAAIVAAGREELNLRGKHADAAQNLVATLRGQGIDYDATFAPKAGANDTRVYDALMSAALQIIRIDGKYLSAKVVKACEDDSVAGKALLIGSDTETGRTKKYLRMQAGRWISRHVRPMLKPKGKADPAKSTWLAKMRRDIEAAYKRLGGDDIPATVEVEEAKEALRRAATAIGFTIQVIDK